MVDYIEVSLKAYRLAHSHGRNAHAHAVKLAAKALSEGKPEECEFWKAVAVSLTPR